MWVTYTPSIPTTSPPSHIPIAFDFSIPASCAAVIRRPRGFEAKERTGSHRGALPPPGNRARAASRCCAHRCWAPPPPAQMCAGRAAVAAVRSSRCWVAMRAAIVSGCRSRAPALPASRSIDPVVDVSRAREGPRAAGLAPPRAPPGRPEQPRCVCPKFAATPYILRIAPACPSFQQHNTRTVAAVATAASGSGFQVMCSSTRCRFCGAVALFVHALADEQLSWM